MLNVYLYIFVVIFFFFFNDTATTEIYTLSLHDALPICRWPPPPRRAHPTPGGTSSPDRKSTRLNSSHRTISYAVFCLKKKKKTRIQWTITIKKPTHKKLHKPIQPP